MPRALILCTVCAAAFIALQSFLPAANAQTVWSGFDVQFSKALFADPTLPENQDRITNSVWITRGTNQGLFNASSELGFTDGVSPQNTEWATALIPANAGEAIAATNWADLTFDDWVNAYGGSGTQMRPSRLLNNNAVVHLITEDIYLDLRFTQWSGAGGAFAYERATGTITPPDTTGDYNGNDVVDAADYVVWRETLGQAVATNGDGADGNRNGTVDPDDYNVWRMNFGRVFPGPASGAASTAAVPEPATCGLFAWILGLASWSRRRS
jgi:hypothetical protein